MKALENENSWISDVGFSNAFSDTSDKAVRVYELAPSEKAIVGRRTVSN